MKLRIILSIIALGTVLAGCTPATAAAPVNPSASLQRWIAGDSYVDSVAPYLQVPTHRVNHGGNGFVTANVGTVETYTLSQIPPNHPRYMLVMAGRNDWYQSLEVFAAAVQHFEDSMTALGITVIYVTEPLPPQDVGTAIGNGVDDIMGWLVATRQHVVDCGIITENYAFTADGHPTGAGAAALAACIDAIPTPTVVN